MGHASQGTSGDAPVAEGSDASIQRIIDAHQRTLTATVQEILDSLEVQCKQKFRLQPFKQELCDKVAEVWVTIPPGIFSGLESLDW